MRSPARSCSASIAERAHDLGLASIEAAYRTGLNRAAGGAAAAAADRGVRTVVSTIRSGSPRASTRTARTSTRSPHSASASSRSARRRRARSPAIRSRACSACRSTKRVINRLGFNNDGVDALVRNVERARCARRARHQHRQEQGHAERARRSTITCSASSASIRARELRDGQHLLAEHRRACATCRKSEALRRLVGTLREAQERLGATARQARKPMLVKIAPDLRTTSIDAIADALLGDRQSTA